MTSVSGTCRVPLILSVPQPASFGSGPYIANPCTEVDVLEPGDGDVCWLPLWSIDVMTRYRVRHAGGWPGLRVTDVAIEQPPLVFEPGQSLSDGTYVRTVVPTARVPEELDLTYTLMFTDNAVSAPQEWDPTIKVKPRVPAPPPSPGQSSSTVEGNELVVFLQFTGTPGQTPSIVNPQTEIDPVESTVTSIRFVPVWLEDDLKASVDAGYGYPEVSITDFGPLNPAHEALFGEQVLDSIRGELVVVIRPEESVSDAVEMAYQLTYQGGPASQPVPSLSEDWAARLDVQPRSASVQASCSGA